MPLTHHRRRWMSILIVFASVLLLARVVVVATAQAPGFSTGAPIVTNATGNILSITLPLRNSGSSTASNVQVTMLTLNSAALITPTTLPTILGDMAGGASVPLNMSFNSSSLTAGNKYLLTVRGIYSVGNSAYGFTVNRYITIPAVGEDDEAASPAQVSLAGVSETAFNALNSTVRFEVAGATLSTNPESVTVLRNEQNIPASSIQITANAVSLTNVLVEGRNNLILVATDSQGQMVYREVTLWAGNNTLRVVVLNESNQLVTGAVVTAKLGDDQRITATATTVNGQVTFTNFPDRTIILDAAASGNRFATVATNGGAGTAQVKLKGLSAPSSVNNNDISLGTAGWEIGSAPVNVIPHDEGSTGTAQSLYADKSTQAATDLDPDVLRAERQEKSRVQEQQQQTPVQSTDPTATAAGAANQDLQLNTSGEGPETMSRTFQTQPGTKNVKVRYRFITSEIPGGYFNTQYNDYFAVTIRSKNGGGSISDGNSMNQLGLAAFDAQGATAWRETSLPVAKEGDTVQVDITVANVADGAFDSQVVVDFVSEKKLAITKLSLNDIDNKGLNYLSTAAHTYFDGNTRIHGTVTVEGAKDDELNSLVLEVLEGGAVVATAKLADSAKQSLLQAFGDDEKVEITTSQLLFELPSGQAANVDGSSNGTVTLRAKATSKNEGEPATKDSGAVQKLVRYTGGNRYLPDDAGNCSDEPSYPCGGDAWVKPSVKTVAAHFSGISWGDFSNMNGGRFPKHGSHQTGNDIDGDFAAYDALNAATAAIIIGHLNDPTYGSRIKLVFVTFKDAKGSITQLEFWNAIKDVTLKDGRAASAVIRHAKGHGGHFHWRVSD
jgi:hypothetical protein